MLLSRGKAIKRLNRKIWHTLRSTKELLMKRNQFTGDDIEVDNKDISDKQLETRESKNKQNKADKQKRKKKRHKRNIKWEI